MSSILDSKADRQKKPGKQWRQSGGFVLQQGERDEAKSSLRGRAGSISPIAGLQLRRFLKRVRRPNVTRQRLCAGTFEIRNKNIIIIFGVSAHNRKSCQLLQTTKSAPTDIFPRSAKSITWKFFPLPCDIQGTGPPVYFQESLFFRSNRRWKLFPLR